MYYILASASPSSANAPAAVSAGAYDDHATVQSWSKERVMIKLGCKVSARVCVKSINYDLLIPITSFFFGYKKSNYL